MKHHSGIDYDHFLDDIRDMYPFSIEEAVLTELMANALDAKSSLIDIRIDPTNRIFELTDNGEGMDKKGFESYHNFSTSFKRKGQGIGFAGLGAKLSLRISDAIVTETRQKEHRKGRYFWGASEWKFQKRARLSAPIWLDLDLRTLTSHGTRVRIHFKPKSTLLLDVRAIRSVLLRHFAPLLSLRSFYSEAKMYSDTSLLINGERLESPKTSKALQAKEFMMHRGSSRKPFAYARFEIHPDPLPEELQGIAISTFGKIIRRDYLKQYFPGMDRITGIIEAPELVDCLTTNKCDFRRDGSAGNKYYRFTKVMQQEFRRWLEQQQILDQSEARPDKDVQRLQRTVLRIVEDMPDLQPFFGGRGEGQGLTENSKGELSGSVREPEPSSDALEEQESEIMNEAIKRALEKASESDRSLDPGGDIAAVRSKRHSRSGPRIRSVAAPDRKDISWVEGDTVCINSAHPSYTKAVEKKVPEFYSLVAAAVAMLREVPTDSDKLELIEEFLRRWGKL